MPSQKFGIASPNMAKVDAPKSRREPRRTAAAIRFAGFNLGAYERTRISRAGYTVEVCANRRVEQALEPKPTPLPAPSPQPNVYNRRRPSLVELPPATAPLPPRPASALQELATEIASELEFMAQRLGPPPLLVFPTQTRLDVDRQRRLVVLDREDIVAAVGDDLLAQVALAEDGVAGNDAALDRQNAQQLLGRLVFVGLGIDAHLRQHGACCGSVGGDEVMAGQRAVSTATQGLAIHSKDDAVLLG